MPLVDTVDPTDINLALQHAIGVQLQQQLPRDAAAAILNAPYFDPHLTSNERGAAAERADAASRYCNRPHGTDTWTC